MWREDSTRGDLRRLASALATRQSSDRFLHRTFHLELARIAPAQRPRLDAAVTQRLALLRPRMITQPHQTGHGPNTSTSTPAE